MKCLRSKKRKSARTITTPLVFPLPHPRELKTYTPLLPSLSAHLSTLKTLVFIKPLVLPSLTAHPLVLPMVKGRHSVEIKNSLQNFKKYDFGSVSVLKE